MHTARNAGYFGRTTLAAVALGSGLAGIGLLSAATSTQPPQGDEACAAVLRAMRDEPNDSIRVQRARGCAMEIDGARRDSAHGQIKPDLLRLMATHAMIPEYHDEQRLANGTGGLGPQAGIYASPNLDDFTKPWQFAAHGNEGVLVGYVVVNQIGVEALPLTYQSLGLKFGLNCVWLSRLSAGTPWRGIVRPAQAGGMCNRNAGGGTVLAVEENALGGTAADAYPPVARFGETQAGNPLLGFKCLNAWCELGAGTFVSRPPLGQSLGLTSPKALVKGWHDEQILSVPRWSSASSYVFVPSSIRAALIPAVGVEDLEEGDFQGNWKPVASFLLEGTPGTPLPPNSKYARWGLKQGENIIELRWDLMGGGRPVWSARMLPASAVGAPTPAPVRWHFNRREQHWDAGIPGTVRFRWTIMDDGIWAPCGQSCCQVEG